MTRLAAFVVIAALCLASGTAAARQRHAAAVPPGSTPAEAAAIAATIVPSARQLSWQGRERIAFLHFGMNTFTDREWGTGSEDPSMFDPDSLDAREWIETLRDAGFTTAIITAKHHDGFCLWPSAQTDHSVRRSPWKGGKGDVVREVADACREYGLRFGVYLSPWDRHEPRYGQGPAYDAYLRAQLRELLTGYGEVAEVWFDGANGEGPNGKRQVYDWASYYRVIRELQPGAVIFGMGPDARWVGNESGVGRETEWSVVPVAVTQVPARFDGDHPLDDVFVPGDMTGEELASPERLAAARVLAWYPAETDVSIRPGWFHHATEDARVRTPSDLASIYESSVGRNSVLLLNVPPDRHGRIAEPDRRSLLGMRRLLDATYGADLLGGAVVTGNADGWSAEFPAPCRADRLALSEEIARGQHIEAFRLEARIAGTWNAVATGTTVGAKRIVAFPETVADGYRLVVTRSRGAFRLASSGLHRTPPRATVTPPGAVFVDSIVATLASPRPGALVHYTLDGSVPDASSPVASGSLTLRADAMLTAVAIDERGVAGEPARAHYHRSSVGVSLGAPPSPRYGGIGASTLVDGLTGSGDHADGRWLGFEGDDMVATIDLGADTTLTGVTAGFLDDADRWILPPDSVTVSVSADGERFTPLGRAAAPARPGRRAYALAAAPVRTRFVRVEGHSPRVCPAGHPGEGKKCWIFVDEISILTR